MMSDYVFPGMNPWLESPKLWSDVHFSLMAAIAHYLRPIVAPRYYVAVETQAYIGATSHYPDLSIAQADDSAPVQTATLTLTQPTFVNLTIPEIVEEAYLEIREHGSDTVITAIELLSPTNKRAGVGRESYLRKRLTVLGTATHFIEIDLLRSWQPMPFTAKPVSDYRIFLRRGDDPHRGQVYAFTVRQPVPEFCVPLQADDVEPVLDIGHLLKQLYQEARYDLRIDYHRPPTPRLAEDDMVWAKNLLENTLEE